jgi:hypothetical protein
MSRLLKGLAINAVLVLGIWMLDRITVTEAIGAFVVVSSMDLLVDHWWSR